MVINAILMPSRGIHEMMLNAQHGDEPIVGFVVIGVLLLVIVAIPFRLISAKKAYQDSLGRLRSDPNNPTLREKTLKLGREYAQLIRIFDKRSRFDEAAIANDLLAACARATTGETSIAKVEIVRARGLSGNKVVEEIEKLGQLFITGVITAEEFERGKTLFLGTPADKAASAVELLRNLDALRKRGILSDSEFNMKKWEILSERLLPGSKQSVRPQPYKRPPM